MFTFTTGSAVRCSTNSSPGAVPKKGGCRRNFLLSRKKLPTHFRCQKIVDNRLGGELVYSQGAEKGIRLSGLSWLTFIGFVDSQVPADRSSSPCQWR